MGCPACSRNHADGIASIDLFVVPTIAFKLLFAFVVVRHGRRLLVSVGVTPHPTAEWLARQLLGAFLWDTAPAYIIRDRDRSYGEVFKRRVRSMGIRDRPISAGCPWQNAYVERLIGSIRRECVDHLVIFNEEHLRRILAAYARYYNETRTHLALNKDAPFGRLIQPVGTITGVLTWVDFTARSFEANLWKAQPGRNTGVVEPGGHGSKALLLFALLLVKPWFVELRPGGVKAAPAPPAAATAPRTLKGID